MKNNKHLNTDLLLTDEELSKLYNSCPCGYRPHESYNAAMEFGDAVRRAQLNKVISESVKDKCQNCKYIKRILAPIYELENLEQIREWRGKGYFVKHKWIADRVMVEVFRVMEELDAMVEGDRRAGTDMPEP